MSINDSIISLMEDIVVSNSEEKIRKKKEKIFYEQLLVYIEKDIEFFSDLVCHIYDLEDPRAKIKDCLPILKANGCSFKVAELKDIFFRTPIYRLYLTSRITDPSIIKLYNDLAKEKGIYSLCDDFIDKIGVHNAYIKTEDDILYYEIVNIISESQYKRYNEFLSNNEV